MILSSRGILLKAGRGDPDLEAAIVDFIGATAASDWRSESEMKRVHPNANTYRNGETTFPISDGAAVAKVDYTAGLVTILQFSR